MELHLTATECHLPYGITQCYLSPDTHPALYKKLSQETWQAFSNDDTEYSGWKHSWPITAHSFGHLHASFICWIM